MSRASRHPLPQGSRVQQPENSPRMDPYERADITSDQYNDWRTKNIYLNVQGVVHAEEFIETFKEYPPNQAPASFTVDPDVVLKMLKAQQAAMGKD